MTTATKKTGSNVPSFIKLFDDLVKLDGKKEAIGRELIVDFFNNAASVDLEKLACGKGDTTSSVARNEWLTNNLAPMHGEDLALRDTLAKQMKAKDLSQEQYRSIKADHTEVHRRIEQRRSAMNRAVPAAFHLLARNAKKLDWSGSKKNKIMFTFEGDNVDKYIHGETIKEKDVMVPVGRSEQTFTSGDLADAGEATIAAWLRKREASGVKTKVNAKKTPKKGQNKQSKDKITLDMGSLAEVKNTYDEIVTALNFKRPAEEQQKFVRNDQFDNMLVTSIARGFGTYTGPQNVFKELDVTKFLNWLITRSYFKGHLVNVPSIEPVKEEQKPVEQSEKTVKPAAQATKTATAKKTAKAA
jgi:hypothetical protein